MLSDIVLTAMLSVVLLCSILAAVYRLSRPHQLTILDTRKILRQVEAGGVSALFDQRIEHVLRTTFSPRAFRESQLRILSELLELFLRMQHNAFVFQTLARTEIWRETVFKPGMENCERYIELANQLRIAAANFRIYSLMTLLRIHFWLVFRCRPWSPFPPPQISDLRDVGGIRFNTTYARLREAVGALYLEYGEEFYEEVMALI